jgi:hypothetical protein
MNEDWMVPPPPPSLKADRELYRWLTLVHDLLNGVQSGFVLSMDTSGGIANAAAARAGAAARLAEDALLLVPPQIPPERYYVRALSADAYLRINALADVDASGGAVTITLPSAASNAGRMCGVAKNDSSGNAVIVSGNINGDTSAEITLQYTALWFISVGSEWRIW